MRFWFFCGEPPATDVGNGVYVNRTPVYTELFIPSVDFMEFSTLAAKEEFESVYFVVNYNQIDDFNWMISLSWDSWFESWCAIANDEDPAIANGFMNATQAALPVYGRLVRNGLEPAIHDLALWCAANPNDYSDIWLLTATLGNVEITDMGQMLRGRPMETLHKLLITSFDLLKETSEGPLSVPGLAEHIGSVSRKARMNRIANGVRGFSQNYGGDILSSFIGRL